MMRPSEATATVASRPDRGYLYPRSPQSGMAARMRYEPIGPGYSGGSNRGLPHPAGDESISSGTQMDPFAEEIAPGGTMQRSMDGRVDSSFDGSPESETSDPDGDIHGGDGSCPTCGGCDRCGGCGTGNFLRCLCHCLRQTYMFSPCAWENFSIYTGKQGFKNPVDQGVNGDFGYHGGLNWGSPLWNRYNIGYQLGGAILLSDFDGGSGPLGHSRSQFFATTGVYRRATCNRGFQGGLVVDYLADNFYVNMRLFQIRGEVSYLFNAHELGFWFAAHTNSDTQTTPAFLGQRSITWQANDQFNLFYRHQFCNGSTCRTWAGLTSHADGLFGSDATLPFSPRWGAQASANYLLPRQDGSIPNNTRESWSLMISLVWYPGYRSTGDWFNPYRPLIPVADNGWFMETVK
jgi:hypothetical protein